MLPKETPKPPGGSTMSVEGPLKCTELDDMQVCPNVDSPIDKCISTTKQMGAPSPDTLVALLDSCVIAADVSVFLANPTPLAIRIDQVLATVQFDDTAGVNLLGIINYPPNVDNLLGTVRKDYFGALVDGNDLVRLPVRLDAVTDGDAKQIEVCIRAGYDYFFDKFIILDMLNGRVSLRLQNFPINVHFVKRGIGIRNIPKEEKVLCVDFLAQNSLELSPLGAGDRM